MAKHMCADHEELYKNLLKPQMKVGNEIVDQVSNNNCLNTLMHSLSQCQMYKIHSTGFRLKLTSNDVISVKRHIKCYLFYTNWDVELFVSVFLLGFYPFIFH
jgi:hypothetical protein